MTFVLRASITVILGLAVGVGGGRAQSFPIDPSWPLATGAFIQLNNGLANKSVAWWQTELASMKAIGMDTVVVQYVGYGNSYFYPTSVPGANPFAVDSIERILAAADAHGMDVHLGVHLDPGQFSGTFNLTANTSRGIATMHELHTRYGGHDSLAGWYMPQEFSDYTVFHEPALRDNLVTYTRDLTVEAHSLSGKTMMISPYFGQNPNGTAYAAWWDTTGLPATGVDIFNLQDGVGTHRTTIAESRGVFEAMAPVMAEHGVAFWANNESFNQTHGWPVDGQPFAAVPTSIITFRQQLESTSPLVAKSVTFEFSNYFSPQGSAAAAALYGDYQNYYQSVVSPGGESPYPIDIVSYEYQNPATTSFHSSASDPGNSRLIDGSLGSLAGGASSAFANGSWVGFGSDAVDGGPQPKVVFDLGGVHRVDSVELSYLVAAAPYIFAPQEVPGLADALTISVSADGLTFLPIAATNDFVDWATDLANGAFEQRSIQLPLGGVEAQYISIDVRSPNTWTFLGEFRAFAAPLPGDFNLDGQVSLADYDVWKAAFGSTDAAADGNRDRVVDAADYTVWRDHLSALSGAAAGVGVGEVVPEPTSISGAVFTLLATTILRRWRPTGFRGRGILCKERK